MRRSRDAVAAEGAVAMRPEGTLLLVRVQPRGSRDAIEGVSGGRLRLRVTAPPVRGAANRAVCEMLAERLGLPRRTVRIVAGEGSREKSVLVEGVDAAVVAAALGIATKRTT